MAGSRESPGLRDQWRRTKEPRGSVRGRDPDQVRDRGTEHERGRNRIRGKFKPSGFDRRSRSPPSARQGPSSTHEIISHRGSPPHTSSISRVSQSTGRPSLSSTRSHFIDRDVKRHQEPNDNSSRASLAGGNASHNSLPKRKRSRSRSPQESRSGRLFESRTSGHQSRGRANFRGKHQRKDLFQETSKNHSHRRRRPSRFGSRHEEDSDLNPQQLDSQPFISTVLRNNPREPDSRRSPSRESNHERYSGRDRSPHSTRSDLSRVSRRPKSTSPGYDHRMSPTRPGQATAEESKWTSPRRAPSFDAGNARDTADGEGRTEDLFPNHGSRPSDTQNRGHSSRPRLDIRQYSSPQFMTPNSSYHDSPQSGSPHSSSRVGWNSQSGMSGRRGSRSPRHSNFSSQGPRQQSSNPNPGQNSTSNRPPSRPGSPQRGGYNRGSFQDRRFTNHGPQGFSGSASHRGRGHFSNLQWVASGPRSHGGHRDSPGSHTFSGSNTPQHYTQSEEQPLVATEDYQDMSKLQNDPHTGDAASKHNPENEDIEKMPPPDRQPSTSTTPAKEGGKFSFAFKTKVAPTPATKPVPDLAQRMQVREPPRAPGPSPRVVEPSPRGKLSGPPPPKFKHDSRSDRKDRDRDYHRGRGRDDPKDFRDRNPRDSRRDDRRFDSRDDRRRDEFRPDTRPDRRRERSPEPKKQKRIVRRLKPRPTLLEEYRESDSVYFRKPGNESVIGAGTYGKVFKAVHIYTQDKVALKRIRMEGEKDGFPVTAMREIKLLQHLRHNNIVSLLEVMVEKNECFMVFEYLSHDLTGLINHPTFTLTESHKKDLAKQMFEGLHYLHHRGVLHRDIKAANILISNRGQLKYADFGLARFFSKSRQLDYTNRVITIWYRPPELLLGETRYGPAVDIWSAACVFVEMFSKKAVFPGDGREISQLDKLYSSLGTPTRADWPGIGDMPWVELMGPTERKKRVFDETYKDTLSPAALDLVSKIFQYDPVKRPSAEEILGHDYFLAEEPGPRQATELENIQGDWHEFESKALRKEKDREARREKDRERDKEKRKASTMVSEEGEREAKRSRQEIIDTEDR